MHDDVACGAASAAAAAGAESQCGCEGRPPDAHSSRHAGACLDLHDAIDAYHTFQCFGALTNESYTQKGASQEHSVASDHACGVTQMRMASGSAGERACAPTEDLAHDGAAYPTSRSNGVCLLETPRTDEGALACAHATRHCALSRCDGIAACDPVGEETGFSGYGWHAACAADVMCSQHASPQQIRGRGILDAVSDRGAQLGGHSGASVLSHVANRSGDVEERAEKTEPHEPFQCMKCAKDKQKAQKLLGESGEVFESAQEALRKIQDVHVSDELMHFEFWGPFWELTEVRTALFPCFLFRFLPVCRIHHHCAYECCKCPPLQCLPCC
jgi:hypothetical protein